MSQENGPELEKFKDELTNTVAETLFAKFTTEQLRDLVTEVLTRALKNSSSFYSVEQQIQKMAMVAMTDLLKEDTVSIRIKTYVKDGIEAAMEKLPGAVKGKVTDLAMSSVSEAISRAGRNY